MGEMIRPGAGWIDIRIDEDDGMKYCLLRRACL
jgi:hypothetical protein